MLLTKNKEILSKYMPSKDLINEIKKSVTEDKKENPKYYKGIKYTKEDYIRLAIQKMWNKELVKKKQSQLFRDIADEMFVELNRICTVENIDFGGGYFIYSMGQNSVIHFNIKELPGWKFAFWFMVDDKNPLNIHYDWFCQQELFINKFKPSRSAIVYEDTIITTEFAYSMLDEERDNDLLIWSGIADNIKYMLEHPYLAAYRDYYGTDFNTEYITESKAKREIKKAIKQKHKNEFLKNEAEQLMKDTAIKILQNCAMISGIEVIDRNKDGLGCIPRYDINIAISKQFVNFADDIYDKYSKELQDMQKKIRNKRRYKNIFIDDSVSLLDIYVEYPNESNGAENKRIIL